MRAAVKASPRLLEQLELVPPSELRAQRKSARARASQWARQREDLHRRLDASVVPARGSRNVRQLLERLVNGARAVERFRAAAHRALPGTRARELWEGDEFEALQHVQTCAETLMGWLIEEEAQVAT